MIDNARQPVLVLGASGFIGARVVSALAGHSRFQPIATSRRAAKTQSWMTLNAVDAPAMRAAVQTADLVVNCIAGSEPDMIRATEALCAACPRRLVHLSSMAVYGAATGIVREDQAAIDPLTGYGQAKRRCEEIIRDSGVEAVVLRPTCVFGPGSPQWTKRIARLLRARRLGDLGNNGDGCCNLAYIDDLVAAIVAALDASEAVGRTFNINNSAELTWNAFLVRFARMLGATPVRRIPAWSLRLETTLLAPVRRIGGKLTEASFAEAITPSLAALFRQDIRIDAVAASTALGLPRTPMDQMMAEAAAWLDTSTGNPKPTGHLAAVRS